MIKTEDVPFRVADADVLAPGLFDALFAGDENSGLSAGDSALWQRCVAAHRGYQLGLELLLLLPRIGTKP